MEGDYKMINLSTKDKVEINLNMLEKILLDNFENINPHKEVIFNLINKIKLYLPDTDKILITKNL